MENEFSSKLNSVKRLDEEASRLGIGGNSSPDTDEQLYKKRMQKRKEIQSKRLQSRSTKKNLIIVFTGNGKGKTTASLGMALRAIGHKEKVAIIQFIKGSWTTGEEKALKNFPDSISWHSLGEGFTWETQNRIKDEQLVKEAWQLAKKYITNGTHKLIILDEINIATKLGYLSSTEIISFIKSLKKRHCHLVLTGRSASKEILELADLVSEINLIKHPFKDQGIKAQKCIEY
tara:strand:+ start:9341 stop:10036 length:696 start_codon:yes stop_codon:yes gene_type:complete